MTAAHEPSDAALLAAVARLWEQVDPPPADLADGALARIAAEDLEFELLTLVESEALAGVRHAAPEPDESGTWQLEYEGPNVRIYVRLTRIEDRTRLDGWVVPARSMTVRLQVDGSEDVLESTVDEHGRFEFATAGDGLSRLTFVDDIPGSKPRVTPPFWI
jgi:hypothetical protein